MTRLEKIEARLAEIEKELGSDAMDEKTEEELDKMEEEVRSLKTEKEGILKAAEKRKSLEKEIAEGRKGVDITHNYFNGGNKEMQERTFDIKSAEYRSAWLNNIRGIELSDVEKRALTTVEGSVGAAVPATTVNKIVDNVIWDSYLMIFNKGVFTSKQNIFCL